MNEDIKQDLVLMEQTHLHRHSVSWDSTFSIGKWTGRDGADAESACLSPPLGEGLGQVPRMS